jgi:transposase
MKQLFIGLDVHKKSWAVTLQEEKLVLKRFTMEADADILINYVSKHYPQHQVECCYESCCCGYHIYHSLAGAGWRVLVVNPGDIARGHKLASLKTDRVDSAHLCSELSAGRLRSIYVPTHEQEQYRSLFRRRNELVKSIRRTKCRIKSMLLYYGIVLPEKYDTITWSREMLRWLHDQHWSYAPATQAMYSRLAELQFLKAQFLHVSRELRAYARKNYKQQYYLLRSIPGVGPLTAIGVLAEVGDIKRFKGIDQLSAYVGLVPALHSSGSRTYTKGLTHRSKSLLRSYLIEAAWVAAKKDPTLMQYYRERQGCDHRKLIIKLAAKTLSRIYHVIKSGEPYRLVRPSAA